MSKVRKKKKDKKDGQIAKKMEEKGTLTFLLFFLSLLEVLPLLPSVRLLELSPVVLLVVVVVVGCGLVCNGGPNRSVNSLSASDLTSGLIFTEDSDFSRLAVMLGGVAELFEDELEAAEPGPEDDCSSC